MFYIFFILILYGYKLVGKIKGTLVWQSTVLKPCDDFFRNVCLTRISNYIYIYLFLAFLSCLLHTIVLFLHFVLSFTFYWETVAYYSVLTFSSFFGSNSLSASSYLIIPSKHFEYYWAWFRHHIPASSFQQLLCINKNHS